MRPDSTDFLSPMQAWPALSQFTRIIHLPKSEVELFYYDVGDRDQPAMLMVHGLGDEADTWRYLISPLALKWRVIAPDLPGFGRSSKPRRAYKKTFFLQVLDELVAELSLNRAFLIGHSFGAALVHEISIYRPELVSGLVLLDGSIILKPEDVNLGMLLFLLPGCGEWLYTRLRSDPDAAYRTLKPYYVDLGRMPKEDRDFLFTRVNQRVWNDDQRRAYLSTLRNLSLGAASQSKNLKQLLSSLNVPTLVLWGENDRIYAADSARELEEIQPDIRFVMIPGAGHNIHQEQPEIVIEQILSDNRFMG